LFDRDVRLEKVTVFVAVAAMIVLREPSALLPPPFSSRFNGMPQL